MCGWTAAEQCLIPAVRGRLDGLLHTHPGHPWAREQPVALPAGTRQQSEEWTRGARQLSRKEAISFGACVGGEQGHQCRIECTPAARVPLHPSLCILPSAEQWRHIELVSATLNGFQDLGGDLSLTSSYFASTATGHALTLTGRRAGPDRPLSLEAGLSQAWSPPMEGELYVEAAYRRKRDGNQCWRVAQRVAALWERGAGAGAGAGWSPPRPAQLRPKLTSVMELPGAQCRAELRPPLLGQRKPSATLAVRQRVDAQAKGDAASWDARLAHVGGERSTLQLRGSRGLPGWQLRQHAKLCSSAGATLELRMRQTGPAERPLQLLAKAKMREHLKIGVSRFFRREEKARGVVWEAELDHAAHSTLGLTWQRGPRSAMRDESAPLSRCSARCSAALWPPTLRSASLDLQLFWPL
eukprot:jgi/Tetstr1/446684/TSEL_003623.t1